MKISRLILSSFLLVLFANHSSMAAQRSSKLESIKDKASYTIGATLAKNFKQQGISLQTNAFIEGLLDVQAGRQLKLNDAEMRQSLQDFQRDIQAQRATNFHKKSEDNRRAGVAFLAKNKKRHGIVTLASGLQYRIVTRGHGAMPKENDTVQVEYTGRLLNGEVFDTSKKLGKPARFRVNQVIKGWTEALQLMRVGADWIVYIPADLAYGERDMHGPIGPNETLIFKIHLVSIDQTSDKQAKNTATKSH